MRSRALITCLCGYIMNIGHTYTNAEGPNALSHTSHIHIL